MSTQKTIVINADVKARLTGIDNVLSDFRKGLKDLKINTKDIGLNKLLTEYDQAYDKFQRGIAGKEIDLVDASKVVKDGEKVIKLFRQIQSEYGDLSNIGLKAAKKLFPEAFTSNIKGADAAIKDFQKNLAQLGVYNAELDGLDLAIRKIDETIEKINGKKLKIEFDTDIQQAEIQATKAQQELEKFYSDLEKKITQKNKAKYTHPTPVEKFDKDDVRRAVEIAEEKVKTERISGRETAKNKKAYDDETQKLVRQAKEQARIEAKVKAEAWEKYNKTIEQQNQKAEKTARNQMELIRKGDVSELDSSEITYLQQLTQAYNEAATAAINLKKAQKEAYDSEDQRSRDLAEEQQKRSEKTSKKKLVETKIAELKDLTNIEDVFKKLQSFDIPVEGVEKTAKGLEKIKQSLEDVESNNYKKLVEHLKQLDITGEKAEEQIRKLKEQLSGIEVEEKAINQMNRDINDLEDQFLQFFSLSNTIELFKRTVRESIRTVKELDAVMTETAVVTDFTIGDMWEKLPEYAKQASKLGTSIKDLYSATTLYYQQGLKSDAAMSVGVETMKMARIANMEASDATQAMTAALRGFNMEINETSAARISDVYSELAAITAADTSQIATAMTKTASIADSANMEFETTAALLAQIIETTQEAPETAGTAMKTIIARFTEVKELFDEGMLTGEDEEGEEININKIDAALKKVGISLKDFLRGEKGIDDIFLELASKWDTLDLATQRYIATTAAGSRQQSRFIAMMSNYERTMELVSAANNSAGASQNQYEKTLDSMEAKLQRLQNAWDTFVMNLANQDILKFGIDLLTEFLNAVNNLTQAFSGGNGLTKTLLSFMTVIGSLKGGKALLSKMGFTIPDLINLDKIEINGKKLGGEYVQSISTGIKRGWTSGNFKDIFLETKEITKEIFDEDAFKEQATKYSKEIDIALNRLNEKDPPRSKEEKEERKQLKNELLSQKERYEQAAQGNIQAGKKAGMKEEDFIKTKKIKEVEIDLTGVATAAMLAGSAVGLLSSGLSTIGIDENITEGISNFGASLVGLGSAASALTPILTALGVTAGPLAITIGVLATAFTFLPYAFQAIHAASPEGKLEAAKEATEQASQAANDAADAYESLKNSMDNLDDKYDALNKMTKGTQQWKDAAHNLNEEVFSLIEKNEELGSLFKYEDGVLVKKSGADAEISRILKQNQIDAQRAKNAETQAKINELKAEENVLSNYGMDYVFGVKDIELIKQGAKEVAKAGMSFEQATGILTDLQFIVDSYGDNGQIAYEKFLAYGNELLKNENIYDAQLANNIKAQAQLSGKNNEIIESFDSNLIADLKEKEYQTILDGYKTVTSDMKTQYANMMGYERRGNQYFNKTTGTEVEGVTDDAIKVALASAQADKTTVNQLSTLAMNIDEDTKFSRALSEEGIKLKTEEAVTLFENLQDKETVKDKKQVLAEAFNFDVDFDEFASRIGIEAETLFNNLQQNIQSANSRIINQRKNLIKNMAKYSTDGYRDDAYLLRGLEDKYGEDFRGILESIFDSTGLSKDDSIIGQAYNSFLSTALSEGQTIENLKELSSFVEDIDWSNPIESAYRLNQEIEKGSGNTKAFSEKIKNVGQSFLGVGSQTRYFVESSDFTEIQEELSKILETSDSITAENILDLADSYDSLNKLLKNTEGSAAGVAKALQMVSEGDLDIYQLTDAVMASLSGFDSLNSMIAKLNKSISDFDVGISESFVTDFIAQANETIQGYIDKGAYGNAQIDKYYDYLFGKNWDQVSGKTATGEERVKLIESLNKYLSQNTENMFSAWKELADGQYLGTKFSKEELKFGLKLENGEIVIENEAGLSTSEMVNNLAEATGMSKTWAEMLLANYKEYSADIEQKQKQEEIDAEAIASKMISTLGDEVGQKFIDESEIDAVSKVSGLSQQILREALTTRGAKLTSFYDESGQLKSAKDAYKYYTGQEKGALKQAGYDKYLDKVTEEYLYDGIVSKLDKGEAFNLEGFKSQLNKTNLSEEVKNQITQGAIEAFAESKNGQPYTINARLSDGTMSDIEVQAGESFEQAYARVDKAKEQQNLANAITEAFVNVEGEVNINPIVNTEAVQKLLDEGKYSIQVTASISGITVGVESTDGTMHADGIKNSPDTHDAMVGEEGPELIERQDGTAYLSGVNGPEITTIHAGDTVHTAEETKKIFKHNKGYSMPRFNDGRYSSYGKVSGGKSASGKSKDWENPYDKLYNLLREINEELRQRERIERRYEKLLENLDLSARKIIDISREEMAQLEVNRKLEEKRISERESQIDLYEKENQELTKYAKTEFNERGERILRIDWDLIDSVKDTEEGEKIETYVSQLEEWFDDLEAAEDSLQEIEDIVEEIKDRGAEEYKDLEETIKDAVVSAREEEIEKMTAIDESINKANSDILDSIQKSIDRQREERENAKTERELADKQARLAFLEQDTSDANILEIEKLRKEIEEEAEDYTDTLIDQKITQLQEQNEDAAEQRQYQIELAQQQLDYYIKSGEIWNEIYSLMGDGLDEESGLVRGSRLEQLLKSGEGFQGMSVIGQMEWWKDINNMIAQGLAYLEVGRQLEDIGTKEGAKVEFTTDTGELVSGIVDKDGNVVAASGYIYDNVFQGADGNYYAGKNIKTQDELKPKVQQESQEEKVEENYLKDENYSKNTSPSEEPKKVTITASDGTVLEGDTKAEVLKKLEAYEEELKKENKNNKKSGTLGRPYLQQTIQYKTGGLADFTGPAWLDGTKAKPEYVLNSAQTQGFLKLVDILDTVRNHSINNSRSQNIEGDTYDIDINIETVKEEADIDMLTEKLQKSIVSTSKYRNNNFVQR